MGSHKEALASGTKGEAIHMTFAWVNTATDAPVSGNLTDRQDLSANGKQPLVSPVPQHVRFDHIEATWEAAGRFAAQWLPPLSGCAESRWMILNANLLVQAVVVHVRLEYAPMHQHLSTVKSLLEAEAEQPGALFAVMMQSQDAHVAQEASRAQEHQSDPWFGGLRQALLCIRAWPC
jgi:hypothetical protein